MWHHQSSKLRSSGMRQELSCTPIRNEQADSRIRAFSFCGVKWLPEHLRLSPLPLSPMSSSQHFTRRSPWKLLSIGRPIPSATQSSSRATARIKAFGARCVFGGNICMKAHHSKKNVNIYVKVTEKLRETPELFWRLISRASCARSNAWSRP